MEGWVAGRDTPQKLVWRTQILLMWGQGAGVTGIIRATGKTKRTDYRWHEKPPGDTHWSLCKQRSA
jgi:hypothetical protein